MPQTRIRTLLREVPLAAVEAGVSPAEASRALLAVRPWAATSGVSLKTEFDGSDRPERQISARGRREELAFSMADQMGVPRQKVRNAMRPILGLILSLVAGPYAPAVKAIIWLAGWLLERWVYDPDELAAVAQWGIDE